MSREKAFRMYAGAYASGVHNTSSREEWASSFMNKYAGAYKQYPDFKEQALNCTQPADCRSLEDLKAWRNDQLRHIRTFVPKAYQSAQENAIRAEYESNVKRIQSGAAINQSQHAKNNTQKAKSGSSSSSWPFALSAKEAAAP